MPIETIEFDNEIYPKFQTQGNFMQYVIPIAKQVCKGRGVDIGVMHREWGFPGARPIDISFNELDQNGNLIEAYNLPESNYDYIISSHVLEHLRSWVEALNYWNTQLKSGGVLFLYLPHYDQLYWRPFSNRKHIHALFPQLLRDYLNFGDIWNKEKVFVSDRDINHSFVAIAEKI